MNRTLSLLVLTGLTLASPRAEAARHEVSFEFGPSFHPDDDADRWFDTRTGDALGLRAGGAVLRDRRGFGLVVSGVWQRERDRAFSSDLEHRLVVDRFGAGLKADYDVAGFFFPYLRADANLTVAGARLTPNGEGVEDLDPFRYNGLGAAGRFTGGFEFMIPDERLGIPVTVGFYAEAGYLVETTIQLDALGTVNLSGAVVRSGIGLRF